MSARAASPTDTEEDDRDFIVFDGSSAEDMSHAKQLWNSVSLQPPQESRLVSADIRQRLPVSRPQRSSIAAAAAAAHPKLPAPEPPRCRPPPARQREEERRRYRAMAEQRSEILATLRRQREQRIQKELLSVAYRQRVKNNRSEMEREELSQLQDRKRQQRTSRVAERIVGANLLAIEDLKTPPTRARKRARNMMDPPTHSTGHHQDPGHKDSFSPQAVTLRNI